LIDRLIDRLIGWVSGWRTKAEEGGLDRMSVLGSHSERSGMIVMHLVYILVDAVMMQQSAIRSSVDGM